MFRVLPNRRRFTFERLQDASVRPMSIRTGYLLIFMEFTERNFDDEKS